MRAELATTMDVPSWSEIVREVEPLFGSMPDFEAILIRKIDQGAALSVFDLTARETLPVCWVACFLAAARHRDGSDGLLSDPAHEAPALGNA
jgi:hypothetical protein